MSSKEDQIRLIDLLKEHERTIGRIYKEFARKLPEHADFWLGLSVEEEVHSTWLRQLAAKLDKGEAGFVEGRFHIPEVESSLDCLRHELGELKTKPLSAEEALSIALDIENMAIEKEFYRVFYGDAEELRHLFIKLANRTRAHIERIQRYSARLKAP